MACYPPNFNIKEGLDLHLFSRGVRLQWLRFKGKLFKGFSTDEILTFLTWGS